MAETFRPRGSSSIARIEYGADDVDDDMVVEFMNGSEYVYHNVPKQTYLSFIHAGSVGQYFHRQIKEQFAYEQR